jgi:hypothetical protein
MRWRKEGVLVPPPRLPWARSHAAVPVAEPLRDGTIRLYFSTRDELGRAHITSADVDLADPSRVPRYRTTAILGPGRLGTFDDSGVTTSCLIEHSGLRYLYYTGWSRGVTVPFYLCVGCAISSDGGETFERVSEAPVLERSDVDPFLTASPWVLVENGRWRMWYVSGTGWRVIDGEPRHWYHVKYCVSDDGVAWQRSGHVSVDYAGPEEHAFGRPCVVRDGDLYRMWYCSRGRAYRIGYAESANGLDWQRKDSEAGLEPSPTDWDSEMQAYPLVLDSGGKRYLLYNGNGYGETGIGYAVLEEP